MDYKPNKCEIVIAESTTKLEDFFGMLSSGEFYDTDAFIYLEDLIDIILNFRSSTTVFNSGIVTAFVPEFISSLDAAEKELDTLAGEELLIIIQHNGIAKLNPGLTQRMINFTNKVKGSGAHLILITDARPKNAIADLFENITVI